MEHLVTGLVARRFYLEGQTKSQIADELGISRFKVARILESALREGIVRIEIEVPPEVDLELGRAVESRFGLRQVLVIRTADDPREAMRRQLGRACASLLVQRLSEKDLLGISWGRTLHAFTEVVPAAAPGRGAADGRQRAHGRSRRNSLELLRRLGASTRGPTYPLHVPMILDSAQTAAVAPVGRLRGRDPVPVPRHHVRPGRDRGLAPARLVGAEPRSRPTSSGTSTAAARSPTSAPRSSTRTARSSAATPSRPGASASRPTSCAPSPT